MSGLKIWIEYMFAACAFCWLFWSELGISSGANQLQKRRMSRAFYKRQRETGAPIVTVCASNAAQHLRLKLIARKFAAA
jgi:hypothetical protein